MDGTVHINVIKINLLRFAIQIIVIYLPLEKECQMSCIKTHTKNEIS
jgi:hypothetical protein